MPHQCVRCNNIYEDNASEILAGCPCGGKLFFYIKKEKLAQMQTITEQLSQQEKAQMEMDVYDLIEQEPEQEPVVLEIEAVRVTKPGKYELDLVNIFRKQPLVIKLEEGKYFIDLPASFGMLKKHEKNK